MDLLIIRHGIAEARSSGGDDDSRRLTDDGRKKMRRGAKGLIRLLPELEALVSSPLVRARETAEIVAEAYGGLGIEETACLEPEREPKELSDWLSARAASTSATTCTMPSWSRRSMKHTPPRLRATSAQPQTVTACPIMASVTRPQYWVRMKIQGFARLPARPAPYFARALLVWLPFG